ncbi:MAG: hypothetical protein ACRD6N_20045 [Pyrinomonadaceae bacterium]
MFTKARVAQLRGTRMSAVMQYQREQWLQALEPLNRRIDETIAWLKQQPEADARVQRLCTHPGIGLLTALTMSAFSSPLSFFWSLAKCS